ncbi:SsrA-binding protein [Candidatus Roizmanbacteria bacterium RIFCSPHIGHO2_02_FULL_40_13b]|uniref:SsrA-binding protein n=1 Tax=Candidatus Roizmanbacteria bacterium RIFCSPHIGHO2_01_FULL_39_24 TaxID=1802032 RepID=A0A1F7GM90_9BACT|nr:MAG: SsrA-binding protein [Candidatus Roizmanbacteria bacterium RIFCSPHIGHO2_01_FULL_39_24]OGK27999.1 MAG: SsrA-binding protein [Candidatus Roizmanbacteria bacterium RIFCSPHIGHO2_02_FULL_40_13b]OGK49246.1 MAG: SsrA-binding protein [Candidatus Roizmanbacteria bacterium RIFCSPLOWO2_01_FULL_40_32]OGK57212.1 MAG: SsrA-binding protein [Candidatus Roizmanbacteria bacterium RIFCSPLOWO2_02_FULL_39_8]
MRIYNKKATRDYTVIETYEAGIALHGAEVKAVRAGNMKLEGAHVRFIDNELFLVNSEVSIYKFARPEDYNPTRTRKLLLHKGEILRLRTKMKTANNLTVIPIACYNKKSLLKLEIALVKSKKNWEKKRVEQRKDEERKIEKEMKEYRG